MDVDRRHHASVLDTIRELTGITGADHVVSGLARAMSCQSATAAGEYDLLIRRDPAAYAALVTETTVGETYFLRESGQFDFLAREVFPSLSKRAANTPLRVWSAGCATGEEAYSLAIAAVDAPTPVRVRVVGTDIAESRLAIARKARYGQWSLRGVPAETVRKHFTSHDQRVEVVPGIRSLVEFHALNLADSSWVAAGAGEATKDIVFCRNVLIYLDEATIAAIASRLLKSLAPEGWLFLAAGDPMISDIVDCEVVITGAGVAYRARRRNATVLRTEPPARPDVWPAAVLPAPATPQVTYEPATPAAPPEPRGRHRSTLSDVDSAYGAGEYLLAAERAREIVDRDVGLPEVWILLVRSLANLGCNDDAGAACATGLDANRTSVELTFLHATLLRQAGRSSEALEALRCALYLDPSSVMAHLASGDILARMGKPKDARRCYRNALQFLGDRPDEEMVHGADGLDAGRLGALARIQLSLLDRVTGA